MRTCDLVRWACVSVINRQAIGAGVLGMLAFILGACPLDGFKCTDDAQCFNAAGAGWCEANGFCSRPDATCSSGRRYVAGAGEHSEQCVDEPSGAGTGAASSAGTTAATGAGSVGDGTTTQAGDDDDDSATAAATTDDPAATACDDQYGDAPGYVLCAADARSCTFYVDTADDAVCDQVCSDYDGSCLGAWSGVGNSCELGDPKACDVTSTDQICACASD